MTKLGIPAPHGWKGLKFGSTTKPYTPSHPHRGQDWGWFYGNPALSKRTVAPAAGKVTKVVNGYVQGNNQNNGWGNFIEITLAPGVVWRACHYDTNTMWVRKNQNVTEGTYLGPMGQSGKTDGPHLHEELWINGVRVNPETYRGPNGKHLPGTPTGSGGGSKPFPEPEEEMPTIVTRTFAKKNQVVQAGKKDYLRLNDKNDVTVATGPLDVTNGVIYLRGTAVGGPFDEGGFPAVIQVDTFVETVGADNKTVTKSESKGIAEVGVTAGGTYKKFPIEAVSLAKGERLRFRVSVHGITKFTVDPTSRFTYVTFK